MRTSLTIVTEQVGRTQWLLPDPRPERAPTALAHVWPHSAVCQCGKSGITQETGEQVQDRLQRTHPNSRLYGKKDYIQVYAYVLGIARGGHWRFFAQERPNGGPITGAFEVLI